MLSRRKANAHGEAEGGRTRNLRCFHAYIYIYREREREIDTYIYIYIYIYMQLIRSPLLRYNRSELQQRSLAMGQGEAAFLAERTSLDLANALMRASAK